MDVTAKAKYSRRQGLESKLWQGAILLSLVLLNVLGLTFYGRLDWTRGRQYSLSAASVAAVAKLAEPVVVRAYFSQDLPPPHASQARYVRDLLDSFHAQGGGKFRFEFIDPLAAQTSDEADRKNALKQDVFGNTVREATAMEQELEAMGIPSVQVRVNQADKLEIKRAYMGLTLSSQGKREVIPVVADTAGLEYDITSMLRKLSQTKEKKLAFVTGHGGTTPQRDMAQAVSALSEHYAVGEVHLDAGQSALADVDALLVVGPHTAFTAAEEQALCAYAEAGHPLGLFLPPAHANLEGLQHEDNAPGLDALLARAGLALPHEFVLDAACATINVAKQQGYMRFAQPVRYPFVGEQDSLTQSVVGQGLSHVLWPFSGSVQQRAAPPAAAHTAVWARSSAQSWLQPKPFNLDPLQAWQPEQGTLAPHDLMVAYDGPLLPAADVQPPDGAQAPTAAGAATRLVVAASDAWMHTPFFGKANEALLLNVVDWLMGDDDLLAMRTRGLAAAPLQNTGEARRRGIKYGNMVGLPLAVVGLGLQRWRRRAQRRREVYL